MPHLYFSRDLEETEKEEQDMAEKAETMVASQGEQTALAPMFISAQLKMSDWSEGVNMPCMPIQQFPTEHWSIQPYFVDWSATPSEQTTEWVGTTSEWSGAALKTLQPRKERRRFL